MTWCSAVSSIPLFCKRLRRCMECTARSMSDGDNGTVCVNVQQNELKNSDPLIPSMFDGTLVVNNIVPSSHR